MIGFPAMLRVEGRRAVVVGGGGVALRRARALSEAGAEVTVIAPHVRPEIDRLGVRVERRPYRTGDLAGAFLVVVASDDRAVNDQVCRDAAAEGVLTNRADDPAAGDLTVPAHAHAGPLTLAVHSGGISARAAAEIRDQLLAALDPDWITLLQVAQPYRKRIQQRMTDPAQRQAALRRLTDAEAMRVLKESGEAALRKHVERLTEEEV